MLIVVLSHTYQGLSGEFEAQIALSIREQLRDYSRVLKTFAHLEPYHLIMLIVDYP